MNCLLCTSLDLSLQTGLGAPQTHYNLHILIFSTPTVRRNGHALGAIRGLFSFYYTCDFQGFIGLAFQIAQIDGRHCQAAMVCLLLHE